MAKANVNDIALFFIALAQDAGEQLTHMKLQKLLYYAQAWFVGTFGEPLFDGKIEAWKHGPVCPEIYQQYKQFHNNEIPFPEECDNEAGCMAIVETTLPPDIIAFLNSIADDYMNYTAYQLRAMTHKEQPWIDASRYRDEISVEAIHKYYGELVVEDEELAEIEAGQRAVQTGCGVEWIPGMFS